MNDIGGPPRGGRHVEYIQHPARAQVRHHGPVNNPARPGIEHDGPEQEACCCRHEGDVGHPQPVWPGHVEVTFDKVMGRAVLRHALSGRREAARETSRSRPSASAGPRTWKPSPCRRSAIRMQPRRAAAAVRGGVGRAKLAQQGSAGGGMTGRQAAPQGVVAERRDDQDADHGGNRKFGLARAHELENPFEVLSLRTGLPRLPKCRASSAGEGSHGGASPAPPAAGWSRRNLCGLSRGLR